MLTALGVFVGGAIGGLLRYGCTRWLGSRGGVLVANLVACYVLGLSTLLSFHPALVATGLAGALSTWSTLAKETGLLIQKHQCLLQLIPSSTARLKADFHTAVTVL